MKILSKALIASAITASLTIPVTSNATNGILLNGYGAKAQAMGGAQIALANDAIATAMNPAGSAFSEDRADVGIMMLRAQARAACCLAPGGELSEKEYFFIPNMAGTMQYNDDLSFGASFLGYGGGRTQYPENFFDGSPTAGNLGIEWALAVMSGSIAYKLDDNQSVGAAVLIGMQRFRAKGLYPFRTFSIHFDKVTNNGYDWSFGGGIRLGWQGHFDDLKLGATYQSKLYMSEFKEYKGLFAEEGNLDIPGNVTLGLAYQAMDDLTIVFDWQHVFYEDVPAIGNRTLPISAAPGDPNQMGQPTGPGFGWKDQDVFKLGAEYIYDNHWTIRAGLNYGDSPIRDDTGGGEFEVNVLAPAVSDWHISAGGTYTLDEKQEINFAFIHALRNKETQQIPANTDLPFTDQEIELEMRQYAFEIGYGYKF